MIPRSARNIVRIRSLYLFDLEDSIIVVGGGVEEGSENDESASLAVAKMRHEADGPCRSQRLHKYI